MWGVHVHVRWRSTAHHMQRKSEHFFVKISVEKICCPFEILFSNGVGDHLIVDPPTSLWLEAVAIESLMNNKTPLDVSKAQRQHHPRGLGPC